MKTFDQLAGFGPAKYLGHQSTHVCWKGGGDTVESLPDWYRPFVEKAAGQAGAAYDAGALSQVQGLNTQQKEGINGLITGANRAETQYNNATGANEVLGLAARGQGIFSGGATQGLKDNAISEAKTAWSGTSDGLAKSNAIGGSRAGLLEGQRDANLANKLSAIDYQDLSDRRKLSTGAAQQIVGNTSALQQAGTTSAQLLGEAGGIQQEQGQRELDATYQGISRLGSLLAGAPIPGQQQKSGGK